MYRLSVLIPLGLVALGLPAALLVGGPETPIGERIVEEAATWVGTTKPAEDSSSSPAAVVPIPRRPGGGDTAPPPDDPEALAVWFQEGVMQHLEPGGSSFGPGGTHRDTSVVSGIRAPIRIASAQVPHRADAERVEGGPSERSDIDWAYLEDVFDGQVFGIPNERRAGISLQEIDELGDIPYIEQLRAERRYEELLDLGFEEGTAPWPQCLRTASCRRDPASSPP
jgi:hypothetical protein